MPNTTTLFARPVYYLAALGLPTDFNKVTSKDVKEAYRAIAGNGAHPDNGGSEPKFALITAAYNELKAIFGKKRGQYENDADKGWMRAWNDVNKPVKAEAPKPKAETPKPKADKPKADETTASTPTEWVFEEIDGESKDDRRKRYARTRQAFRYATDPDFAKARKDASKRSHAKKD